MRVRAILLSLLIIVTCSATSFATTKVKLEIGWAKTYRAGHWIPLYVTASDQTIRNVLIELYVEQTQKDGIKIQLGAAIGPEPRTFLILAPLGMHPNENSISVTLRDPSTGSNLAFALPRDPLRPGDLFAAYSASQLLAIAGEPENPDALLTQLSRSGAITCKLIDSLRLPESAIGYDALNLLLLGHPNWNRFTVAQQDAILDWIRAGGSLLCWIGPEPIPESSPIVAALPAVVGQNIAITIDSKILSGRELSPIPNAESLKLLSGRFSGYRRRLGFGSITLLPADPTMLAPDDPVQSLAFWKPILGSAVDPTADFAANLTPEKTTDAIATARQMLGESAPSSNFNLAQLWFAFFAAAFVAGPVDWLVFRKLGRRGWTVTTVAGWTFFLLLGGIGIVHASMVHPTLARSLQLIDQADGITVATMRAMSTNQMPAADDGSSSWWQPLAADREILQRATERFDLSLHENQHAAVPVGNFAYPDRFQYLLSQTLAPAKPVIDADLRIEMRDNKPTIVGTITNLSNSPLEQCMLRSKSGACEVGTLPAGSPVKIDRVLAPSNLQAGSIWDLSGDRTTNLQPLLSANENLTCLTAQSGGSNEMVFIRALITLK